MIIPSCFPIQNLYPNTILLLANDSFIDGCRLVGEINQLGFHVRKFKNGNFSFEFEIPEQSSEQPFNLNGPFQLHIYHSKLYKIKLSNWLICPTKLPNDLASFIKKSLI